MTRKKKQSQKINLRIYKTLSNKTYLHAKLTCLANDYLTQLRVQLRYPKEKNYYIKKTPVTEQDQSLTRIPTAEYSL